MKEKSDVENSAQDVQGTESGHQDGRKIGARQSRDGKNGTGGATRPVSGEGAERLIPSRPFARARDGHMCWPGTGGTRPLTCRP
jgi:hypothetical protein